MRKQNDKRGRTNNQQEQMERENGNRVSSIRGDICIRDSLLAAAKKKDLRATELLEFVAKKIENFGRQWNSGYINKDRVITNANATTTTTR